MKIFPAIDLFEGKAVRLYKGDYNDMTVYSCDPVGIAEDFERSGAKYLHTVDLEGARSGLTPNINIIKAFAERTGLFVQVGGGIRSMDVIDAYLSCGVRRVVLGTAAVTNGELVARAVEKYGDRIAAGADIKDGRVAIKGWTESSAYSCDEFFEKMQKLGVRTVVCTDISRDGAMQGANTGMYETLSRRFNVDIIASGGVSGIDDIRALRNAGVYGAIIGKAYYTGALSIEDALEVAE